MPFQFEKLDVSQKSLDWVEATEDLIKRIKGRVSYSIVDQLSRASLSIPLNIAEGNGRWHKKDKKQFFWIARGSVFECVPIIQTLQRKNLLDDKSYRLFYDNLDAMAKMLTNLIKAVDELHA